MAELRLKVEDMSCGHCVAAITGAVEKLPGVTGLEVSLETKVVTVRSETELDQNSIMAAIQAAGYIPKLAD